MLDRIFHLLPAWLQRIIEPQVDHLVEDFQTLEAKLKKVADRHLWNAADLKSFRAEIEAEIAYVESEAAKAKRIASKIADLVS